MKTTFSIHIERELLSNIEEEAQKDRRSRNQEILALLEEALLNRRESKNAGK